MTEWEVRCGDALEELAKMPDGTVQTVVTSPPYWGLRDYGTAEWVGGDPTCEHSVGGQVEDNKATGAIVAGVRPGCDASICRKCGAERMDQQLGLESTPEEYVERLVEVFREVRRVLRDDGTVWLNLGDSYYAAGWESSRRNVVGQGSIDPINRASGRFAPGLKTKDLCMIPARVAMALQADGWYLRSDIIWSKPNPMPESVTDRPTRSHEYLFLLSKSQRYFYDNVAIKEPVTGGAHARGDGVNPKSRAWKTPDGWDTSKGRGGHGSFHRDGREKGRKGYKHKTRPKQNESFSAAVSGLVESRNKRSVWKIATEPFPDAHFAVFPTKLVEPCILAGSRVAGKRCDCDELIRTPIGNGSSEDPTQLTGRAGMNRTRRPDEGTREITRREQRAHAEQMKASSHRLEMERAAGEAFAHYIRTDISGARPLPPGLLDDWTDRGWLKEPAPCRHVIQDADIVLDPFCGSGTVGVVALRHGRRFIGIDLSPEYCEMARRRIDNDAPLFNRSTS